MNKLSVIGIFCEDVREEKSGQNIIVGTLPDNLNVTEIPGIFPRLALYVRIAIDPNYDPGGPIIMWLEFPDGVRVPITEIGHDLITKARQQATTNNLPLAGIISRTVFSQAEFKTAGIVRAMARAGGTEFPFAALNVRLMSPPAASASGLQPSQSPAAAPGTGS